ncbi:hypothetical protein, partial [Chryseobacterium muglaense]|uniref:hypothetical protein n=1 Tax=Chryseobacterium muglaense TaxID=2893752 RepID=UPI001E425B63
FPDPDIYLARINFTEYFCLQAIFPGHRFRILITPGDAGQLLPELFPDPDIYLARITLRRIIC